MPRSEANASVPDTVSTIAAIRPAYGLIAIVRAVTKAGPPTKISSSATDSNENAVCSLAGSSSTCVQRARTIEPSEIPVAPDAAPAAYSVHSGAPACAHSIRVVSEQACSSTRGSRTRAWPNRSTSRPARGPATATAIEKVAATAPAFAYEPVMAVISRMTPMPSIDMGARPMNPVMTKPLTPGVPNSPRYGPTMVCSPSALCSALRCPAP
ncbi:hypothetical protein GCM10027612_66260 [Microbispora bryophytorum subsp. camponoti]